MWEKMQILVAVPLLSQPKKNLDGNFGHSLHSKRLLMLRAINSKTNPELMQTLARKHMLVKGTSSLWTLHGWEQKVAFIL